ncbi:hypothetical protein FPQ18DRAFT_313112 [Pyronema domesticum]|nr:hypothetical protein FPQ18DRAFT_313112 [Pyronema domesticum]
METYPAYLYPIRMLQGLLSIGLILCTTYAVAHPAYWLYLFEPAACTIITSIFTLLSLIFLPWQQYRRQISPTWFKATALDGISFMLFIVSLVMLVRPVKEMDAMTRHRFYDPYHDGAWELPAPPREVWRVARVLAGMQVLLFSASTVVVFNISTQFSSTPARFRNEKGGLPIV